MNAASIRFYALFDLFSVNNTSLFGAKPPPPLELYLSSLHPLGAKPYHPLHGSSRFVFNILGPVDKFCRGALKL